MLEKLQKLDRRWIFLFILVSVIVPLMFPLNLGIESSAPVERMYNYIENLPEGSVILMSFDFSPSTEVELGPAAMAVVRHAFAKNHKVVAIALWPDGGQLARPIFKQAAEEFGKEKGRDYVNLGYKAGGSVLLMALNNSFANSFPADIDGTPVTEIPLMNKIQDYSSIDLAVSFGAGANGLKEYILIVNTQFGVNVAGAVTAVSAPEKYPFLNSGQLLGLMGGLKGAAEYEKLLMDRQESDSPGRAMQAMDAQSVVHMLIVLFIVLSNVLYFVGEYRRKRGEKS
jgi:hypothetical protein